ncbi:hypothetical protein N7326_00455 [Corynebacterium sp. ES2794-CONJ1]|uniref:hypothetical protein n=1 Tax=unclassified Corynebacterium TaxID=2624378 RepID=UPI0021676BFD|nr:MULTISPECIES: hypothetical protein [unclassified Corynebacterium]MCS4491142.1 hypothetical protein [Corynebacterium sp. ES2715-CONJ3]MCS4530977.1 hypothetical protein [Corynebacterium sp. ES2730-CONJ]MCU9518344.1 hypothetical protein [Corynebacterium sp. ES2794-CONJ1]
MKYKALGTILALTLTACNPPSVEEKLPVRMGSAFPEPRVSGTVPHGDVIDLDPKYHNVEDMERVGDILALRSKDKLAVGTVADFRSGQAAVLEVDPKCGDMTAAAPDFLIACPDGVNAIDAKNPKLLVIQTTPKPVTAVARTSDGTLFVGNADSEEILAYKEGNEHSITMEGPVDQLIAVARDAGPDSVYRTNRVNTTIQNIYPDSLKAGAVLRVGLGVGEISAGSNGMALAADAIGHQFGVYLADDVIRLHQTTPTHGQSPWDLAWDKNTESVWVATTADSSISGYTISSGVGQEIVQYSGVSDIHNIEILDNGDIVAASASGAGLQIISRAQQ